MFKKMSNQKIVDLEPMRKEEKLMQDLGKEPTPIKIMFLNIPLSLKAIKGGLMKLRKFLGFSLILILLFSFACAGKTQTTTLAVYESTGVTLEGLHQTAESMCDSKILKGKDCNKMVSLYAKCRAAFLVVGEASKGVARATDAAQKKQAIAFYTTASNEATRLFNEFVTLASQLGIIGGTTK